LLGNIYQYQNNERDNFMYSVIRIYSTKLKKEIDEYIIKNEQHKGYFSYLGITKKEGNKYISDLPITDLMWKLSSYFNQAIVNTIQFGEFGLINQAGDTNPDTPFSNNYAIGDKKVWANAFIAQYDNETHEALNSQ